MREILFRGKRIDNGEWVEGYITEHTMIPHDMQSYIGWVIECKETELYEYNWYEVDLKTVGQYTGLKDKNGKRIFEGDIGKYKQTDGAKRNGQPISCTGKVIYNTKTASYAVESKDEAGCKYFDYFPIKDFEVIGNMHDNPELLEVR